ncbi:uncharacterized protein LOC132696475 isoform X2 [Cylas formicarius]|uniref:uncharacterized protein LOC132696475 isoform X2 n=1 Tax=Cylas formicarius TaxID=197179 RepID=UPI002958AEFD|nr:uncharacterized protein LOC132696475 isoform X2 [Cylas formicarius]
MSALEIVKELIETIKQEIDKTESLPFHDEEFYIPEDLDGIRNLYEKLTRHLKELKKNLDKYLTIVEKTELISNILSYKTYEVRHNFRMKLDELRDRRECLKEMFTKGEDESTVALQLVEINDEIDKLEGRQLHELEYFNQQKIDAQKEYEQAVHILDADFKKMVIVFNRLLRLVKTETYVSDDQDETKYDKSLLEIEKIRLHVERYGQLQVVGWKELYPEEKVSEMLEKKGLKVSLSGLLMTDSGRQLSFKEAKALKFFEGFSPETIKELQLILGDSGKDEEIRSWKSGDSTASKICSEDANYLKRHLGRALTLGLAEITALQPRDPIHYLGHWLFKYRYNQQMEDVNKKEFEILNEQRMKMGKERWASFHLVAWFGVHSTRSTEIAWKGFKMNY